MAMKSQKTLQALLAKSWDELADLHVDKRDLRADGWSEARIKRFLGKPKGRHPSEHFRNPLGQPYWTGPQVLSAALRCGWLASEVKAWPYTKPIHGLTHDGRFLLGYYVNGDLVMHPEVEPALIPLIQAKRDLVAQGKAQPALVARNLLANPNQTFGEMLIKVFRLKEVAFPPTMPAVECLEKAIWMYGKPEEAVAEINRFVQTQRLLAELQCLPEEQDIVDALAVDIDSGEHRYESLGTSTLAELCGIEPADGDAARTSYAHWYDLSSGDQLHEFFPHMAPYISPQRLEKLQRWAGRIDEYEAEFDEGKLTKKEKEVLELLYNTKDCGDRSYWAVCTHHLKSRNGQTVAFQFCVGDGGDIEDSSGPYAFHEPSGFDCDDPDNLAHPKTGRRLKDLLWKAKE
jgi:hypothetical protein